MGPAKFGLHGLAVKDCTADLKVWKEGWTVKTNKQLNTSRRHWSTEGTGNLSTKRRKIKVDPFFNASSSSAKERKDAGHCCSGPAMPWSHHVWLVSSQNLQWHFCHIANSSSLQWANFEKMLSHLSSYWQLSKIDIYSCQRIWHVQRKFGAGIPHRQTQHSLSVLLR